MLKEAKLQGPVETTASDAPSRRRHAGESTQTASPALALSQRAAAPDPSFARDSYAATAFAEIVDRSLHSAIARFTAGLSPMALTAAYLDWASHLAFLPGKRIQLVEKARQEGASDRQLRGTSRHGATTRRACIEPLPQDRRFDGACVAALAVRPDLPVVPADAAVVAQRHDRGSRRHAAARGHGGLRHPPDAGHVLAVELPGDESGGACSERARVAA